MSSSESCSKKRYYARKAVDRRAMSLERGTSSATPEKSLSDEWKMGRVEHSSERSRERVYR